MATVKPTMKIDEINKYLKKYRSITFTDGTYNLTAPMIIYSNTEIKCKANVTFVRKHKGRMLETYDDISIKKYNGTHDVTWTGGKFIADTNTTNSNVIVLFHAKNITLKDITIDGCRGLHSLEVNASSNIIINNCNFKNQSIKGTDSFREALQIDFAYKDGLSISGAENNSPCYDATHCNNITIENCTFINCPNGIGTHTVFSEEKFHKNITIKNCIFKDITEYDIKILGMKDVIITDCKNSNILINKLKTAHSLLDGKVKLNDYRYNSNIKIDNIQIV